jgi:hypothetical protein
MRRLDGGVYAHVVVDVPVVRVITIAATMWHCSWCLHHYFNMFGGRTSESGGSKSLKVSNEIKIFYKNDLIN